MERRMEVSIKYINFLITDIELKSKYVRLRNFCKMSVVIGKICIITSLIQPKSYGYKVTKKQTLLISLDYVMNNIWIAFKKTFVEIVH